jgi:dimethylargininase
MLHALVREVSDSYPAALAAHPPDPPIEVARARAQHLAYRQALASLGMELVTLPADERFPDGCFVEDTAVMLDDVALMTRPGALSRRGEVPRVAEALARHVEVETLPEPGTLDGGDCLRLGRTLYVGCSARTDAHGVDGLRQVAKRRGLSVVAVPLPAGVLHLKSFCSPLPDGRLLLAEEALPASIFVGTYVVRVPAAEAYGANVLSVGETVLVSEGFERAIHAVEAAGFRAVALATTEFRKADAALTCLSILF